MNATLAPAWNAATENGDDPHDWETAMLTGLAGLDRLAPEWDALCALPGPAQAPFFHPGWVRAHVCAFEAPTQLALFTARYQGRLIAVLPLIRERVWFRGLPVRRWRGAAGVHSLRFDLAAAAGPLGENGARAIGRALRLRGGWDLIELRDVPAGGSAEALLAEAQAHGCRIGRWASMQTPYIDLSMAVGAGAGAATPAGMQGTKAEFRHHLRRTRRKLEALAAGNAPTKLRLVRAPTSLPSQRAAELDAFYALEASGWKGRNGTAIACLPAVRRFYDQAAAALSAQHAFLLHRLELDGHPIAMSYSLCLGEQYYAIKWCYDELYAKYGPGHLLTEAILADCVQPAAGAPQRRFDFTGPDADYKQKWTQTRLPHSYLYIFRGGAWGALLHDLKFVWTPRLRSGLARLRPWR